MCYIYIPALLAGYRETIQVTAFFRPGEVDFKFRWKGGYLSTSSYGNDRFWMQTGAAKQERRKLGLYIPHPLTSADSIDSLYHLPVQRVSPQKVAALEITMDRGTLQENGKKN